jgi:hypothetical protein
MREEVAEGVGAQTVELMVVEAAVQARVVMVAAAVVEAGANRQARGLRA